MISRLLALRLLTISAFAQSSTSTPPPATNEGYEKPFAPFHIIANVYYVGMYDLGCYLIVTPEGNLLINTGIGTSVPMIRSNIEKTRVQGLRHQTPAGDSWEAWRSLSS